ncbi:hypothetical protein ALC62_15849 [Cyphomyrmex costatus]|uniref:Uncharacterized protein n=1 Tax=Cyphomyrmex costatus TaxID=456900 RepID=A0A195BZZ1_9HYME|nr:hypothetical protein ALC62_15849 [Cyphomyrmex costatus]
MKKPILYKVETYIVPDGVENLSIINEIDDLKNKSENIFENNMQNEKDKLLTLHNKHEEFAKFSTEDSTLIGIKLVKGIMNESEIPCNEHLDNDIIKYYNNTNSYHSNKRVQKMEFQASVGPQESLYPVKQFSRVNSLMSIDERNENSLDTKLNNFCCHGYKNGCTASVQSPEEVSEEIFTEAWLHKIEILRNRETILREKEINLQERERELFRREKKLRIAERLLNEKMKQAEQQIKYQRDMLVENTLEKVAQKLSCDIEKSDNLVEEKIPRKDYVPKKEDIPKKKEIPKAEEIPKKYILRKEEISRKEEIPKKLEILKKTEIPKNLQPVINPCEKMEEKIIHPMRQNSLSRKSSSKVHSYATLRYKQRPKINYDDLNSTLSAASVDTLNVRTSVLFDPVLHKKPCTFSRSASERCIKNKDTAGKLQRIAEEKPEHMIEEKKIFRKVSNNICALQEKETRFQDYGLVDCIPNSILGKVERNNENRLSSHLNLETGERYGHRDQVSASKNRPISWTSETDKWLQQYYMHNPAIKQSTENKENVVCNKRYNAKTKTKSKKFFLFH